MIADRVRSHLGHRPERRLTQRLERGLEHRRLPWILAALAMLLCIGSLWIGWNTDDYVHRAALVGIPGLPEATRAPWELFAFIHDAEQNRTGVEGGHLPWWTSPEMRAAFFRPLAGLTHWLDYQLWPNTPLLMHVHSLLWFGGVVLLAALLYRRLLTPAWVAGLAALLFAVDDAHGLPAGWLAARNATLTAFFGLLALLAHDRWRRDGWRTGALLGPLALALGLLCGEGTLAVGGYLLAYALILDRAPWPRRLSSLTPYVIVGGVWAVAYKLLGYGVTGSSMYVDPSSSPWRFAGALFERAPLVLFQQWVYSGDMQLLLSEHGQAVLRWGTCAFLAILAAAFTPLLRRDRVARFWALGMLLAVVPPCSTALFDRLLFFVGLGAMGSLAQFIPAVRGNPDWLPLAGWRRVPIRVLAVVLIFIHLVISPLILTQKAAMVRMFSRTFENAAASLPTDPAVSNQTLVILNAPTAFVPPYAVMIDALQGKPTPARIRVLGSSINAIEFSRPSEHAIIVRPDDGFFAAPGRSRPGHEHPPALDMRYSYPLFDRLFWDGQRFPVGHRVALPGVTIEVTETTPDGRPAAVSFTFAVSLDDPSLRWLQWVDGAFAPADPPAIGQSVTLPPVTVPFW